MGTSRRSCLMSKIYKVVTGDSLSKIAAANGITLAELLAKNPQFTRNGRNINFIHLGETVVIPQNPKFNNNVNLTTCTTNCVKNNRKAGKNLSQVKLDRILDDYQITDDTIVDYTPNLGPYPIDIPFVGTRRMTETEANLLNELGKKHGLIGMYQFKEITSNNPNDLGLAYQTANQYYPQTDAVGKLIKGGEDGHNDAFRHTYWNALMTKQFGKDFAEAFATAHEGVPGNPADKEAMDLYNNAQGRRIAHLNPDKTDEELADLVNLAIQQGETVVIDGSGDLKFSNQVAVGDTGSANDPPKNGVTTTPPEWSGSN